MYANLKVSVARKSPPRSRVEVEHLSAWEVEILEPGYMVIRLDGNDGTGGYAEPAGEHVVNLETHTILIEADF